VVTATERLLGVLLVVVAAGLRVVKLGAEPLGSLEAASTWPAWASAVGDAGGSPPPGAPPASALLFGGQWALFWLAGSGTDALARAWPAALGTALVVVPWLMRPAIGREATLALVALLAVEPVLVGTSRLADGAIASGLGALLVVACVVRARAGTAGAAAGERARRRWLRAAAVSLGLLMASGPAAWSYLLLLGVAGAGALMDGPASPAGARRALERGLVGHLLRVAAASAVLAATVGLTQRQGLAGVSASLTGWLTQWHHPPGPDALARLLVSLVVEQPLTLGLGALGLATTWRETSAAPGRRPVVLLVTVGLAAAMAWVEGGTVVGRLPLTLLLTLAAARAVGDLSRRPALHARRGARLAASGVAVGVAALGLVTLRSAVQPPSRGEATQAGARLLAADAASLCAWQVGDARECPVRVVGDPRADPLLAWYLRDLVRLRWVPSPPSDAGDQSPSPLIVTPDAGAGWRLDALASRLPEGYAGSRYRIRIDAAGPVGVILWVPPDGSGGGRVTAAPPSEPEP